MDEEKEEICNFDVTMVPYNDPKICELVGLFILYKFQKLNKINSFGLLQR